MTAAVSNRGRVLSRQQVRFSDAPVKLATNTGVSSCQPQPSSVSITTDPMTGDVVSIQLRCSCGEVTVVELDYQNNDASK